MNFQGKESTNTSPETYNCPICRDAGFVHPVFEGKVDFSQVVPCRCQLTPEAEKRRQAKLLEMCNISNKREHCNFENFKTYGDTILVNAVTLAKVVASSSPDVIFLTIIGESDRGKSHLAIATCQEWIKRGSPASYINVPKFLQDLRNGFDDRSYSLRMHHFCNVGLLVLDDLGSEKVTEWGAEQIQTIINYRYDEAKHTIITTNRPLDDLFNYADYREGWRDIANMRVKSRLERESWCRVIVLSTKAHIAR